MLKCFTKAPLMTKRSNKKRVEKGRSAASAIQREEGPPQVLQNAVLKEYEDDNKVFRVIGYYKPSNIRFSQYSVGHESSQMGTTSSQSPTRLHLEILRLTECHRRKLLSGQTVPI